MKYQCDFSLDESWVIEGKYKSKYMENYQKYIDEFCTPPQYQKKNDVVQKKKLKEMDFDEMLKSLM